MPTLTVSGTTAIEDASLISATLNYGGYTAWQFGYNLSSARRQLVRIASSSIPSGSIASFSVSFYRTSSAASAAAGAMIAYAIKDANTWVEGSANGAGEPGAATTTHAKYNTQPWAGSVLCGTSGVDYHADPSPPSLAYDAFASGPSYWMTMQLTPGWAVSWRDGAWVSNGFVLRSSSEESVSNMVFTNSSEAASFQPYFFVDYVETRNPTSPNYRNEKSAHYDRIRRA